MACNRGSSAVFGAIRPILMTTLATSTPRWRAPWSAAWSPRRCWRWWWCRCSTPL